MINKKQSTKSKRTRAKNAGKNRQELYRKASGRIKAATTAGFYLESIALIESMIADRIESLLETYNPNEEDRKTDFQALGPLLNELKKINPSADLLDCINKIEAWKWQRNVALHEMVKIEKNNFISWDKKQSEAKDAVEKGLKLFNLLKNIVAREKNNRRPQ
jgi:hypothetical protein